MDLTKFRMHPSKYKRIMAREGRGTHRSDYNEGPMRWTWREIWIWREEEQL